MAVSLETVEGTDTAPASGPLKRAAVASFIGSLMEWYDFYIFGTAAALVFGHLFFPSASPTAGTLAAFAAFAVGFVSRPIGAVVFGHIGDRIGRKYALVATAILMGGGTFIIGLLPAYDSIGVWAPVCLVILRLAQGLGIGGEWGGAVLVALEHAPKGKRGLIGSIPQMGTPAGLLIATGMFGLMNLLSDESFMSWGWRIPFLLSIIFLFVALYIRLNVEESPVFKRALAREDEEKRSSPPLLELFRRHPRNIILATGARLADAATFNVINVFGIAYASSVLGVSKSVMLSGFVVAAAVEFFTVPLIGALSDRIGRRPVYMAGIIFCGVSIFAYFPLLASGSMLLAWLAIILVLAVGTSLMYAIQSSFFGELFGTRVRYTGISIGYQLSALLAGAPTPMIATSLAAWAGGAWWPVALYLSFVCLISLVCVWLASETHLSDLDQEPV